MSNLSEEEIIEVLQRVILANRFDGLYTSICIIIEAIQGLLDLYNKEKEKNKELNAKRIRDISGIKNYVSKDKIREKIKECEKEYQIYVGREYTGMNDLIVKIKTLQELLEE